MNKILKFIYTEIAYNGHLQTLGSLFKCVFSAQLFGIKITWDFLIIIYLALYLIYIYNRYKEIEIDRLTNITRTEHIKKFDKQIPLIIFIILASLAGLLYRYATLKFFIFISAAIILGLLYTDYFKGLTKKIFMLKNIYVAMFFGISVFFPFIYYNHPINLVDSGVAGIVIFVFLRGMYMQIILDIKDVEGDKQGGLLTLSVLWSKEKIFKLLKFLSIITAGLVPLLIFLFFNVTPAILMLPLFIIFDYYIISLLKKEKFAAYILESGEFIFWSLLVVVGERLINYF